MIKPFTYRDRETVLKTPIFDVEQVTGTNPHTGHTGAYTLLHNPDWVNVVALDRDGCLLLIRQWRHGTQAIETELPAGLVDPGESPEVAAARELIEETGYAAERWTLLGQVRPNLAYQGNTCWTFLAEGCHRLRAPEFTGGETVELVRVPASDAERLVREGVLRSALSLAALTWWALHRGASPWGAG